MLCCSRGYTLMTASDLLLFNTDLHKGLSGYRDVKTTMACTHVLNRGGKGVWGLADALVQGLSPSQL